MKRFKVWYEVDVVAYNWTLFNESSQGFSMTLIEHTWDWLSLSHVEISLCHAENYDFFECVRQINDYINENSLDKSKIKYPEIYKYVKP